MNYNVPIQTSPGQVVQLKIVLPHDFPKDAPNISAVGVTNHPLLNQNGSFMQLHSLSNWKYPQSTLSGVVQEAYEAIVGRSPVRGNSMAQQSIPSDFPQLRNLSNNELSKLLTDPDAFCQLAEQIISESQMTNELKEVKQQVLQQALSNLEKEEELKGLKNAIAVVRSSEYLPAKEQFDRQAARQKAIMSQFDPEILKTRLASAAQKLDEESELLLAQFFEKQIPLETFLEAYQERRREFHMKDIKCKTALQTIK